MICLLILTAHEGLLESEIRDDETGEFDRLKGVPRALLPSGVAEKKIIDIWWDSVSKRHIFEKGALPTRDPFVATAARAVRSARSAAYPHHAPGQGRRQSRMLWSLALQCTWSQMQTSTSTTKDGRLPTTFRCENPTLERDRVDACNACAPLTGATLQGECD